MASLLDALDDQDDYTFAQPRSTPSAVDTRRSSLWCCYIPNSRNNMSNPSWMDRMKKAGKSVVDAGAKTMLKVGCGGVLVQCCVVLCRVRQHKRRIILDFCLCGESVHRRNTPFMVRTPSTNPSSSSSSLPSFSPQTDIVLLDREIKTRKQAFGIQIYDLMAELEGDDAMPTQEKEAKIRAAFDAARKDIAVIQAKKECKKEEMAVLEAESGAASSGPTYDIPPSDGVVVTNEHPSQMRA